MRYAPADRELGIVLVQLLLFATSWPMPHWPFSTVPDSKPDWSILNQLALFELKPVQVDPPHEAMYTITGPASRNKKLGAIKLMGWGSLAYGVRPCIPEGSKVVDP